MNERSYQLVPDKQTWGEGPWLEEPDKVVWVDDASDLDCMIVRNHHGALCGYVGLPEGHPLHGQGYDESDVDVHGGLTFAGPCMEGAREDEQHICHDPQGRPDNVWWLGFDCGHAFDLMPALRVRHRDLGFDDVGLDESYRDLAYVKDEVTRLAEQLASA